MYFKRAAKRILLVLVLTSAIATSQNADATTPPPPPGTSTTGGGHGTGGNSGPSEAPVGNGFWLLVLLGAAYAGGRNYLFREEEELKA